VGTVSGDEAAGQLRRWAAALCATDGGAEQVAAALGLHGTVSRGDVTVDQPPPGYARMKVGTISKTGAGIYLWPADLPLTREVLDAEFGPGRWMPIAPESRLLPVAYDVEVPGAPASCTIFAMFDRQDAPATEILLRRDRLYR
jgi:hypothetical protein